jgi:hypothetical protein
LTIVNLLISGRRGTEGSASILARNVIFRLVLR